MVQNIGDEGMGWRLTVADFIPHSLCLAPVFHSLASLSTSADNLWTMGWTAKCDATEPFKSRLVLVYSHCWLSRSSCESFFSLMVAALILPTPFLVDISVIAFFFHAFVTHKSWEYEPLSWEYQPLNFSKTLILFPKNINILNQGALLHISIVQGIVNARRPWWLPISLEKPHLKLPLWWNTIENYTIGVGCAFIVRQVIVLYW